MKPPEKLPEPLLTSGSERPTASERRSVGARYQALGDQLVALDEGALVQVPLEDELRQAVALARRLTDRKAKERQLQFVGRLMRSFDPEPIERALASLRRGSPSAARHADAAAAWQARLLEQGDVAIDALVAKHPELERKTLRQLVRQAKKDAASPQARSHRELQKLLRALPLEPPS